MNYKSKLQNFIKRINRIDLSNVNTFGSGMPVTVSSPAGSSSAFEIITKLRAESVILIDLISKDKSQNQIKYSMENIEGYILNLQTFGVISSDFGNSLVSEMYDIVKN